MPNRPSGIRTGNVPLFLSVVAIALVTLASAEEVPVYHTLPKYQTPVPYSNQRNWHVTQNLGPTGARGWVFGHRGNSEASREIMVKSVEPGSPAEGVLRPYDFILGAAVPPPTPSTQWQSEPQVKPFDSDARLALARAITWAESDAGKGKLKLLRHRDGQTETIVVNLPVMGTYSKTAPFACPKTDRMTRHAAEFLSRNMPVEGAFNLSGALNAMYLLAMDDPRFLDIVRRTACRMSINHTINDAGHETWRWGYQNLFLAEYYLATGDRRVLPTIAEYCDVMAKGQCNPGTWGHRAVPDFIPPGYGSMNQSGVICFMSMILGRQCGVPVDEEALARSIRFYGSYAGRGGIPYGDHPPHPHPTCNGKNGSAAVAFNLLNAEPAAQWFARLCASASAKEVEEGHTGNFFNQTWSPIGAGLTGQDNVSSFWSRYNSYRDLARRRDGSFVTQPLPHIREGDLSTGNYVKKGPMWSTGGFALGYLVDSKRLAILGRTESVFGGNVPAALKPALKRYHGKDFASCAKAAAECTNSRDGRTRRMAQQLERISQLNLKSIDLTLAEMTQNLEAGNLYALKFQLQAIESLLEPEDMKLKAFREALAAPETEEKLSQGEVYYRQRTGIGFAGPWGFNRYAQNPQYNQRAYHELKGIATRGKEPYAQLAQACLARHPFLPLNPDVSLFTSDSAKDTPQWIMASDESRPANGWEKPEFDADDWNEISLPADGMNKNKTTYLRTTFVLENPETIEDLWMEATIKGNLKLYLNGTLIVDSIFNSWPKTWQILLKPCTKELLQKGDNLLAVEVGHSGDQGPFSLDLKRCSPPAK